MLIKTRAEAWHNYAWDSTIKIMFDKIALEKDGATLLTSKFIYESTEEIGQKLGLPIKLGNFELVQKLKLQESNTKSLNTYSGNYGFDIFPFHTDLAHWAYPPRYFILHCITPNLAVGTQVLPLAQLKNIIPHELMKKSLFIPRKKVAGKLGYLRMLDESKIRWDILFLNPVNDEAREVLNLFKENISQLRPKTFHLDKGQVLLVDNWGVLHGRTQSDNREPRLLHRLYLESLR